MVPSYDQKIEKVTIQKKRKTSGQLLRHWFFQSRVFIFLMGLLAISRFSANASGSFFWGFNLVFGQCSVNFPNEISMKNPPNAFLKKGLTPLLTPSKSQINQPAGRDRTDGTYSLSYFYLFFRLSTCLKPFQKPVNDGRTDKRSFETNNILDKNT